MAEQETESARKARLARERRLAIEQSIKDGTFGKTTPAKPTPAARTSPRDVPLGSGSAAQAGRAVGGRARQIDDAVENAQKGGSLSSARRPRSY